MRYCSALILLAAVGCATATGDRSVGKSWWKPPIKDDAQVASKDEKPQDSAKEAGKTNPFRKSETVQSEASPAVADKKTDSPAAASDPAFKSDSTAAVAKPATENFSAETLRLIDAELGDATPQERTYWYEQLKRVDPAVIPQILQARRLTADVVEQQKQGASSAIRTVSGEDEPPHENSAIARAVAEQSPNSPSRIDRALHQAERGAGREFIVPQNFEAGPIAAAPAALADGNSPKSAYAARRVAATETSPQAPAPSLTRNPLSRLLPSRPGAQSSANSPAAVSLLPPTEIQQVSSATQPQLESLISQVEAEIAQIQPGTGEEAEVEYIRRHVYLRMLYLMAHHPERALTAIPGIDPADQEFWQQTMWAMANYFDTEHSSTGKDRASQAVAQLSVAAQRLKERADLEVRNLAFCHEIAYFGNFTRFNRDEFQPGDSVLLYAEIDNFKSELTIDGQYRTLLRSTIEILSPAGDVRWQKEFPANEDLCINYRRDYFLNYRFNIDDRLPLGPHTLKLTVFDELSGKMVSQSINFVVR